MNGDTCNSPCTCRPLGVPWVQEDLVFLDVLEAPDLHLDLVVPLDLLVPLVLGVQVVPLVLGVQVVPLVLGVQVGQVCQACQGDNGVGSGSGRGIGKCLL